jgi:hypothetical protein
VGRWRPDGKAIVFNNPQTFEMYVAEESGTTWTVRSLSARGIHPVYSADGLWIYAGGSTLIRIPVRGGAAETVLNSRAEALAVSTDGKFIYFVREPNDTSLWRLAAGSTSPERVLSGIVPGCSSCWAVALSGVFYLGTDASSFDRQAVFFHPSNQRVATFPEPLWPQGSGPFSLSPDGRYLLVVRVDPSNSDAMLVTPFR